MELKDVLLNLLLSVFLNAGTGRVYLITVGILTVVGYWGLFRKSGIKPWLALFPCVQEWNFGQLAGREREGRVAAVSRGVIILASSVDQIMEWYMVNHTEFVHANEDAWFTILRIAGLTGVIAGIILIIYMIRIFLGLIEVYGLKRKWVLLWIVQEWLALCLLGWGKKYQPLWTAQEIRNEAANFFSNARATVLDQGLTVNLEERTAKEFFKKKYLLRDIHMYVQPGHMVLLLGGSGAGKTTFVNAVNGYEKAKAEIMLNGQNMYKNYKEMQYDIGFVPQLDLMRGSDSVYRTLMDAANLRLPLSLSKADRQKRVEEVMDIFGLTPVKDNLVVKLSGGQRKRLSIAMEFISNPTLFILDEPDSGLDGVMARELFTQLRKIADQGKIIIVITHTPDRVIDLFDDVIVLAKDANRTGRLAFFGSIGEARTFFGKEKMEEIVKSINREEEGGEGRADEFILRYAEVQHG